MDKLPTSPTRINEEGSGTEVKLRELAFNSNATELRPPRFTNAKSDVEKLVAPIQLASVNAPRSVALRKSNAKTVPDHLAKFPSRISRSWHNDEVNETRHVDDAEHPSPKPNRATAKPMVQELPKKSRCQNAMYHRYRNRRFQHLRLG